MEDLDHIYNATFFRNRVKYHNHFAWKIPIVCDSLIEYYHPKSVIDVGCGIGGFIEFFLKRGIDAYGLEGGEKSKEYMLIPQDRVITADIRLPLPIKRKFDLVMCMEVAEHIEPEYSDIFCDSLVSLSDIIIMTAAPPWQTGHYHVNCQPSEYWFEKFRVRCFDYNAKDTEYMKIQWRQLLKKKEPRVYVKNLMIFKRGK